MSKYKLKSEDGYESGYESDGGTQYKLGRTLGKGQYAKARQFNSKSGKSVAILKPLHQDIHKEEIDAKYHFFRTLYPTQKTELIKKNGTYRLITFLVPGVRYKKVALTNNEQQITLFISAIKAIKDCHEKGIVICDLNANNIHYDISTNKSYLIDGGLSTLIGKTIRSSVFQNPEHIAEQKKYTQMAPESWARTNVAATTMMDVYALGDLMQRIFKENKFTSSHLCSLANDCKLTDPLKRPTLDELEKKLEELLVIERTRLNPSLQPLVAIPQLSSIRLQQINRLLEPIDNELIRLENKIGKINLHQSAQAYREASTLLQNLKISRNHYSAKLSSHIDDRNDFDYKTQFNNDCVQLMTAARPILENDLNWGAYLDNILKRLLNRTIQVLSIGMYSSNFFHLKKSDSLTAVEQFIQHTQSISVTV